MLQLAIRRAAPSWDDSQPPAADGVCLCWHCGTVADQSDPPGWVSIARDDGSSVGVCPHCLATHHD